MPTYQLTTSQWLGLNPETKAKLKEIFAIPKSSGSRLVQMNGVGHLESDGHTMADLAAVTLEKMSSYLGLASTPTDFYGTFDLVIEKIEGKTANEAEIEKAVVAPPTEISKAIAEEGKQHQKKK